MKDKKKSFWLLLILFSAITLAIIVNNQFQGGSDMGLSMAGMMKNHHTSQLKPADLLKPMVEDHGMGDLQGHHEPNPLMASVGFITTVIIFIAIPLLLGGTVMLIVLWI